MTTQRPISEADLHAFVDGELTEDERAEVEAALAASPADLETVRDLDDLNEALRQRYAGRLEEPLPPAMLASLARLGRMGAPILRPLVRWAAAAAIVAAAGIAGYMLRGVLAEPRGPEAQFVTTALGAHTVYVPEVRHPVEVKADEAHLVRWLAKRVGADVRAPALAPLGWKLMGGRLLPDRGLPAAQFMYEDNSGRRLTLYVRKETGLNNTSFRFYEKDGFGSFYWIDRPLAYALSGRLSRDELMTIANAVYAQLESQDPNKASGGPGQAQ
jgi:anti-sigma factor RsiW